MNIVSGCRDYLRVMIDRVPGLKCLVLDNETTGIMSMALSQSEILEKEVYLVERIDSDNLSNFQHLAGVFFVRPTGDNFLRLGRELKNPRFGEFHLFFSNAVPAAQLMRLARCDESDVIRQVHEFYADIYPVNRDLFSLDVPSTVGLTLETSVWTAYEETILQRIVDGLFSSICVTKVSPTVRFQSSSVICRKVATQLQVRLSDGSLSQRTSRPPSRAASSHTSTGRDSHSSRPTGSVMLIVDRREDPVTPLLNQWTYQGMVHELIGIDKNRVDMSKVPGVRKELESIVLESSRDPFFESNLVANFGDMALAVNSFVQQYREEVQSRQNIDSIEGMQKFVEEYSKHKQMSTDVSKHVALLHELSRLVDTQNLLEVSSLEQNLACYENRAEHHKSALAQLRKPSVSNMERLRLVLLYALRYENDTAVVGGLKRELLLAGISESQVRLVDNLLNFAGSRARSADLFQNKNFLSLAKSVVKRGIRGVENVYTQHKSLLASTVETLIRGRLKDADFPLAQGVHVAGNDQQLLVNNAPPPSGELSGARFRDVIVFVLGGATYEESRDMKQLAKQFDCRIVLGGSTIHNTSTFLADIAQLGNQPTPPPTQIDFGLSNL
eukprot:Lankesteria_metandrocarpae@DN4967_c0_g1_i3.p1